MSKILQVRDENGNWVGIEAIKGDDYVLTDADKREIAEMVLAAVSAVPSQVSELGNDAGYITADALQAYALKTEIPNVSAYQTEAQVLALIQANSAGTETWTFTLEDGSTVTKAVCVK